MLPQADTSTWNASSAAHLLNRAGFGATPSQIAATQTLGRRRSIELLLTAPPPSAGPDVTGMKKVAEMRLQIRDLPQEERRKLINDIQRQNMEELTQVRAWWIGEMVRPETAPLEKMVLFWHGHFATSMQKVKNADMMWQQNQLFRQFAFGNYRDLVKAISCDPAMVIWLDLQQSRDGAPNENFARELMELFTLGIGHYSEDDIKASARAFTGYRTRPFQGGFDYLPRQHDASDKTFMGKTGPYSGDDIIDIIFQQPACAETICKKLWTFYAYEDPEPVIISSLAHTLRQANYEVRPVLAEMFGSKAFYSERAIGTQIKSPTQLIVQTCRTLECPPPPAFALRPIMNGLGQMLFAPPNVKGWDGNRAWINTATLATRMEYTDGLAGVGNNRKMLEANIPLEKLVTDEMLNNSEKLVEGLTQRMLSTNIDQATRADLISEAEKYSKPLSRTAVREMLAKIMRLPEFQLV